jgi:hypothetical protein
MLRAAEEFSRQSYTTIPMGGLREPINQARRDFLRFLTKEESERLKWSSHRRRDPKDQSPDDGYLPRDTKKGEDDKDTFHAREDYEDILVNENGVIPARTELRWVRNMVQINKQVHQNLVPFFLAMGEVVNPEIPYLATTESARLHSVLRLNAYRAPRADAATHEEWPWIGQTHRDRSWGTVAIFESNRQGKHDPHSRLLRYDGSYRTPNDGIMKPDKKVKEETRLRRDADKKHWHRLDITPEKAVVFASSGIEQAYEILSLIHGIQCENGYPCGRFSAVYFIHTGPPEKVTLDSHFG